MTGCGGGFLAAVACQPVAAAQLPDVLTEPTVTLSLEQLQRFRDRYQELGLFAADVCGMPWRDLSTADMETWRWRHGLPCREWLFRYWQSGGR
jgi:hypothetical protein